MNKVGKNFDDERLPHHRESSSEQQSEVVMESQIYRSVVFIGVSTDTVCGVPADHAVRRVRSEIRTVSIDDPQDLPESAAGAALRF